MDRLSEERMYQIVVGNEEGYDGVFFYAVRTTGIVCRPSCRSKIPNRNNSTFFHTLDEALQQGYRPCKRCRPDLGQRYTPETDVVRAACEIMDREYTDPDLQTKLPSRIGISSSHFQRLFKKTTGRTPRAYLQRVRIAKATELMNDQAMSNLDICMAVGFTCLSSYYVAFRNLTGLSPKEYRQERDSKSGSPADILDRRDGVDSCHSKE